jgi:hypothetical protein
MTSRSRDKRLMEDVERFIIDHPFNDEHRELIRSFLDGGELDEDGAHVARDFVDDYVKVLRGLGEVTPDLKKEISERLRAARLAFDKAFPEAVLHRLADDPADAIKHIEARDAASTLRNSNSARSPRVSRHDWWAERIGDCVDDVTDAMPEDIYEYLLQIEEVSFSNGTFRYAGPETHKGVPIEPMSKQQARAKMYAAKKRKNSVC